MQIMMKKTHPEAKLPVRSSEHAAAYDFFVSEGHYDLNPGQSVIIPLGVSVALPPDYVLLMFSRSGHGFNYNVTLANSVGVIDADYRGEIKAKITRAPEDRPWNLFHIAPGDRIAQGILIRRENIEPLEVSELPPTERGEGGFGSTGQ